MSDKENLHGSEPIDYKMYLDYLDKKESNEKKGTLSAHREASYTAAQTRKAVSSERQADRQTGAKENSRSGELTREEIFAKYGMDPNRKSKKKAQKAPKGEKKTNKKSAVQAPAKEKKPISVKNGGKATKKGRKNKKNAPKKPFFKRPGGIALIVVLSLLVATIAGGLGYYYWYMKDTGSQISGKTSDTLPIDSEDSSTHGSDANELSSSQVSGLNDAIQKWYETDESTWMYNNKIMNVLLIGMDDANGDVYGRSDSMILVSIDTINKQIHMVSFWRDSYGMIVHEKGKPDQYVTFEKINGANVYGGPDCVVDTIEHLYKIRIDGWVMTDFSKFKNLIDAMGGINVDVTQKESEYLARTTRAVRIGYGKDIHLNGTDALAYSRIRHLDSDIMRAERQRKVIKAIIDKAGAMSIKELQKAVKKFLPYLETSYSKTQILTLAMKAVLGGWDEFPTSQQSAPLNTNTESFCSGTINTAWVWVVDYPMAAQDTQKYLYGKTNITLAQDRVSYVSLYTNYY